MPWYLILHRPRGLPFDQLLAEKLRERGIQAETWAAARHLTWLRVEQLTPALIDAIHGCPGSFGFIGSRPAPVSDEELARLRAAPAQEPRMLRFSLSQSLFSRTPAPPPPIPPPLSPDIAAALRRPTYEARRTWRLIRIGLAAILVVFAALLLANLGQG